MPIPQIGYHPKPGAIGHMVSAKAKMFRPRLVISATPHTNNQMMQTSVNGHVIKQLSVYTLCLECIPPLYVPLQSTAKVEMLREVSK